MARTCLKCKQRVNVKGGEEEFHLIFDENGEELELQRLLKECFNIYVVKKRKNNEGLCSECVEELIDTYDVMQKNSVHSSDEGKKLKSDSKNEQTIEGIASGSKQNSKVVIFENNSEDDIENLFSGKKNEDVDDPLEIEQVYVKSKQDLEKYFYHDQDDGVNKDQDNDDDDSEDIGDDGLEIQDMGEILKTNEDSIDIYQYKKSAIKIDPMNNNFENSIFCVVCKENVIFHKNILEHIIKHHVNEKGFYKCIAKENCEEFGDARELSYHLVLKHYDLMFLKIALNCPECKEGYNSFLEYNEHYCCPKGVMNRSKRVCESCNIEFLSHKRFRLHQMFHLPKYRPKICFLCDKSFHLEEDFYEHCFFAHKTNDELKLICKICDKVSTSEELYEKHKKLHLKDFVTKCPICSNSFTTRYRLTLHIRHVHEDREHNDCKICSKEFHFKGQLKLHLERHNEPKEGKVFSCSVCGLCEPDKIYFENHDHDSFEIREQTTDLVYACEFCEQAYIQPTELKLHKLKTKHEHYKCDMCEEKFERHPLLKTHRLTHDYGKNKLSNYPTGRKYVCNTKTCDTSFIHYHELRRHNYTHNWFETVKTCKLCGETMTNYVGMINHLEKEHFEVPLNDIAKLRCPACQKMFKTKHGLSNHMSAVHGAHEFQCKECKRSFKTEQMLLNHHKHFHDNVVCHLCGKTLRNRHLAFHINSVHKKIIRFQCEECDKGYYLNSDLQDHIRLMHNSDKPEKCDQCPFSCHYPSRLKLHILQKHEGKPAPFKCKECSAGFYTENTLRSHMLRHGPREYKCLVPECEWEFFTRAHLISHGKKVHKLDFTKDAPKIRKKRSRRSKVEITESKKSRMDSNDKNRNENQEVQVEVMENLEGLPIEVEYLEEEYSDSGDVIIYEVSDDPKFLIEVESDFLENENVLN